jgi:hypothetical protein
VLRTFLAKLLAQMRTERDRVAVTLFGESGTKALTAGSSLSAVLPDTQVYSLRFPGLFHAQTSFLRENAARLDLRYVVRLGDVVNINTHLEWQRASQAMALLHDSVPYAIAIGKPRPWSVGRRLDARHADERVLRVRSRGRDADLRRRLRVG